MAFLFEQKKYQKRTHSCCLTTKAFHWNFLGKFTLYWDRHEKFVQKLENTAN